MRVELTAPGSRAGTSFSTLLFGAFAQSLDPCNAVR
jgi:hypothetical protein